jgi:hypothetical protein
MRAIILGGAIVVASSVLAGPLPPPGWRRPEPWIARCHQRLEQVRKQLEKKDGAFAAVPVLALATVDEQVHEVKLRINEGGYSLHVAFRVGEQPPADADDARWHDQMLDTKYSQRLLMRHVVRGKRGLLAELALDPDAPQAAAYVKGFKGAIDACIAGLP